MGFFMQAELVISTFPSTRHSITKITRWGNGMYLLHSGSHQPQPIQITCARPPPAKADKENCQSQRLDTRNTCGPAKSRIETLLHAFPVLCHQRIVFGPL